MRDAVIPQPLPAHSLRLRDRRYHVDVHDEKNGRGAYPFIAEGRFTSYDDAQWWVDATYPDAPFVNVTYLSARDGWVTHPAGRRDHGTWL